MTVEVLPDEDTVQGEWVALYKVPTKGGTHCSKIGGPTGRWSPAMRNLTAYMLKFRQLGSGASQGGGWVSTTRRRD